MGQIVPDAIEHYLAGLNRCGDALLDDIARGNDARGLPLVDAEVGALLRVMATAAGASRILEIGTAIGYSGIWLAGALPPGGMLLTMEMSEERAREARVNFARAGVSGRVSVMVGYAPLLDRLVALLRPGGLLITDNVLWDGEVVPGFASTSRHDAADTRAIAEYNERVASHPELVTTIVPLRDGVSISVKRNRP